MGECSQLVLAVPWWVVCSHVRKAQGETTIPTDSPQPGALFCSSVFWFVPASMVSRSSERCMEKVFCVLSLSLLSVLTRAPTHLAWQQVLRGWSGVLGVGISFTATSV